MNSCYEIRENLDIGNLVWLNPSRSVKKLACDTLVCKYEEVEHQELNETVTKN